MKLVAIILFLLPLSGILFAQKQSVTTHAIKGVLIDNKNQALPNAIVTLQSISDSSDKKTEQSNALGAFYFNEILENNYSVRITMIGFEPYRIKELRVKSSDSVIDLGHIVLSTSAAQLGEVTVKSQTPAIQRLLDKTVLNVDNSITNMGTTVLDVLRKAPGVQVSQEGQISLNGKNVNILMDGKSTYLSPEDLATLLSSMQSSSIQKIEIMTNPPAKYDASGAAIINIVKKKNRKDGFNGTLNVTARQGYYGDYNAATALNFKNKWYNISFNNSYSLNKEYFNRTVTTDILDNSQQLLKEQVSYNSNIHNNRSYLPFLAIDFYLTKKTTLSLNTNANIFSGKNATYATMDIFNGDKIKTGKEDFTGISHTKPLNFTNGLHLEQQLDTAGKQLSFDMDYGNYVNRPNQFNTTIEKNTSGKQVGVTNIFLNQYRKLDIYVAKADYIHPLKSSGKVEAGVKFSYVKVRNENNFYNVINKQNQIDSTQSNFTINSENINAAYLNYSREYSKFSMQLGLRGEQTVMTGKQIVSEQELKQNYFQLFPTLFLSYKLNNKNTILTRLGRRVERADYSEMVPFKQPLTPTLYFQGNPNLQPQTSYHTELGYIWNNILFINLSYDFYHNYIRTIPYLDSNKTTITRMPTNIPGVHSWTAEIAYSKKILKWWSLNYDLQVYQNYFRGSVNDYSIHNNGLASVQLNANNDFTINNKLSVACEFEYNSKREFVTSSYGAYSILNIGVKYQVLQGKGSLSLNGNNLLQSEGHNAIDHYESLNQYSYWSYYTRSVRLSFAYHFGSGKPNKSVKALEDEQRRIGN